ncbi:MAG: GDSL-type esterase/lipase family protein [Bacteroidota bacterium]
MLLKAMFIILLAALATFSCSSDDDTPNIKEPEGELLILPLGDSRVEGARPFFESYRYELWKNLIESNFNVDLTGPETDPASYPTFMDQTFDNDHAGNGGDTSSDVLVRLDEVLASSTVAPDVVLLGIGGNDLLSEVPVATITANINHIIDRIQSENSEVIILLEQIAPGRSDINTPELSDLFNRFNLEIPDIAETQTNGSSLVVAVDMSINWGDQFMADEVHYNEQGAKEVADRYFDALDELLDP